MIKWGAFPWELAKNKKNKKKLKIKPEKTIKIILKIRNRPSIKMNFLSTVHVHISRLTTISYFAIALLFIEYDISLFGIKSMES